MGSIAAEGPRTRAPSRKGSSERPKLPTIIADGRFVLEKKLGAGCFGVVFRGKDTNTKTHVAIKVEPASANGPSKSTLREIETMRLLAAGRDRPQGIPLLLHFGQEGPSHCLVMELLGRSLEDRMRDSCTGRLRASSVVLVAEQAISRMEYIHSKGFIHGDIKPENFMFGVGPKAHHLYMIDFGLSKRYFDRKHVPMKSYRGLQGTMRYASINAHNGLESSRRDDLEAVGHMLLYCLRGVLPWSGLPAKNSEEQIRMVGQKKTEVPLEELCEGFPSAFENYLRITRKLSFRERPEYAQLRGLFQEARRQLGVIQDHDFEWFEGRDLGKLEPLEDPLPFRQPDDEAFEEAAKIAPPLAPMSTPSFRKRDFFRNICGKGCGVPGTD
jgi:serine/threonine protein kinase